MPADLRFPEQLKQVPTAKPVRPKGLLKLLS